MKDKRVIFMGTPDFAVPVLEKLIDNTNVVLVVTQPDKKVGRKQIISASPIKKVALKNNIPVFQPESIKNEVESLRKYNPDIIITCAYGQFIPSEILDLPKYSSINVHASLLPKLRGGAPIHKAIIDGYDKTGITIMYMDKKMDNGDIISSKEIKILENDNVGTLHDKLSILGSELLIETLPSIFNGSNKRIKQNENEATFAYAITRDEEKIDFNKNVKDVYNQIRGLYPFPCSYTLMDNEIIKVLESKKSNIKSTNVSHITSIGKDYIGVSCNDYEIHLTKIKPSGKKEMSVLDYLNGKNKNELLGKKLG